MRGIRPSRITMVDKGHPGKSKFSPERLKNEQLKIQTAEKLEALKGHGFSRVVKTEKSVSLPVSHFLRVIYV